MLNTQNTILMNDNTNIVEIFYLINEFFINFERRISGHLLQEKASKNTRKRHFTMSDSEVITILILFHTSNYRTLKHFYLDYVKKHLKVNSLKQYHITDLLNYKRKY